MDEATTDYELLYERLKEHHQRIVELDRMIPSYEEMNIHEQLHRMCRETERLMLDCISTLAPAQLPKQG